MPHYHHCIFVKSSSHKDNPPPQQEQSSSDSFADIPHVQGDFVHSLYQSGALKLVHQLYLSGDAADCGKRVLFGISFENYFGMYQHAMCSCSLVAKDAHLHLGPSAAGPLARHWRDTPFPPSLFMERELGVKVERGEWPSVFRRMNANTAIQVLVRSCVCVCVCVCV
jgi:hypothetical protein